MKRKRIGNNLARKLTYDACVWIETHNLEPQSREFRDKQYAHEVSLGKCNDSLSPTPSPIHKLQQLHRLSRNAWNRKWRASTSCELWVGGCKFQCRFEAASCLLEECWCCKVVVLFLYRCEITTIIVETTTLIAYWQFSCSRSLFFPFTLSRQPKRA